MDRKAVVGIIIFIITAIGGAIIYTSNTRSVFLGKTDGVKLTTNEVSFDFKNISYSGGNVTHNFKIKNSGTANLTVANLGTSCMCTTVYFKAKDLKSPTFGMKGMSSVSSWKGVLKPNEEGNIVVVFDPTAHGPAGVGPVSRIVSFESNDPDHPYVEFTINGTVVK